MYLLLMTYLWPSLYSICVKNVVSGALWLVQYFLNADFSGSTSAAAPRRSGLATLPSVGAVP